MASASRVFSASFLCCCSSSQNNLLSIVGPGKRRVAPRRRGLEYFMLVTCWLSYGFSLRSESHVELLLSGIRIRIKFELRMGQEFSSRITAWDLILNSEVLGCDSFALSRLRLGCRDRVLIPFSPALFSAHTFSFRISLGNLKNGLARNGLLEFSALKMF